MTLKSFFQENTSDVCSQGQIYFRYECALSFIYRMPYSTPSMDLQNTLSMNVVWHSVSLTCKDELIHREFTSVTICFITKKQLE